MELVFQMLNFCLSLHFDKDGTRNSWIFLAYTFFRPVGYSLSIHLPSGAPIPLPLFGDSPTLQGLHKLH